MIAARIRRRLWRAVFTLNGGLETSGALPRGGCVVVANHCSHADAPSLLAALDAAHQPTVAAAADYWFERPGKAWICRVFVAGFPVRRRGGGFADLSTHVDDLRAGRAVVVFPAGSRHAADGRFHAGAFRLAQRAGVPIVPVWIAGTDTILHGAPRISRSRVRIVIGEPLVVTDARTSAARVQGLLSGPNLTTAA
ncbi:MAG TPA: lysophospholipid acyltransferase family protein [Jatrophihabitantaceae bacterium]|nr:lysophospholipid acyltransferase family protein [Jatrophihabitantaceae bacterium]